MPDVQVLHKAVDWALRYDEFYQTNEFAAASEQLRTAWTRLEALERGETPWLAKPGPVALGYVSKIDDSIQPYGLVIPTTYAPNTPFRHRLDFWFHGRGEKLSELAFVRERATRLGEFAPAGAFVLHPYGRYCNGSRFAGETDAWEALDDARSIFPIDDDRLVVRGFSLGGAACWHFAVHHASRWAAAAPGAGFSETAEFLRVFQREDLKPAWWEPKLWRWHDATANAANLKMVPLVVYSGEQDSQLQAARAMEAALAAENLAMTHVIGEDAGHRYTPEAKDEINRRIDAAVARGRDPLPTRVTLVTHTLRHSSMAWVSIDGLETHWETARVVAELRPEGTIEITTTNVVGLTLSIEPGLYPYPLDRRPLLRVDGQPLTGKLPGTDRSWVTRIHRTRDGWILGGFATYGPRKRPGLQGPVDDAFMEPFLFVRPTGPALNPATEKWVASEMDRAIREWRRQYRGDVRIKDDTAVTLEDYRRYHLVLWGDPRSNSLLRDMAERLPVRWTAENVTLPDRTFSAAGHVPILIQANPNNPGKYVVWNSGFTFREYDYLNNARQTPKLPDWAIVDLSQPPNARTPGRIAAAGFFDERWNWKAVP
ncbi:MAG: prolyl oligopeptidase family serine peptidase [Verrucomicrobiales bacterium]|nr:prolyl oligopeptidase family serine peptidase [Verrucomicrobiales bacterium]